MLIGGEWIPIMAISIVPLTAIGWPLARAYARRMERGSAVTQIPSEVTARLERMEQAIDSIAVEVERISEGQRFTSKLLSERAGPAAGALGAPPPGDR
jgi:hypothetical protein